MDKLIIRGARQHNLKNIDLEIPRNRLVVITGVSGSGKSSLAFDTIYAEGQRRYVESLSVYARQFLEQMDKPDVDSIEGLSPAISIEQHTAGKNPRSTVGTVTEIYDYMRLLFARVGQPHCYKCGRPIVTQTIQQIVDQIMVLPGGSRFNILSPVVRGRKGEFQRELARLRRDGFVRARIDGHIYDLSEDIRLDKNREHVIEVVVDRLVVKEGIQQRLADSLEVAASLSEGLIKTAIQDGEELVFSQRFACPKCGVSFQEVSPRLFSFNSPYGACPKCGGLGTTMYFDPERVVPNTSLSIREGAIVPWEKRHSMHYYHVLDTLSKHYGFNIHTPFRELTDQAQQILLYGSGDEELEFYYEMDGKRRFYRRSFEGVIPYLERRFREAENSGLRDEIQKYMTVRPCPSCKGSRLKKESLFVKINNLSIDDMTRMSIRELLRTLQEIAGAHGRAPLFGPREQEIARPIVKEIINRLGFLTDVGLDYLTIGRSSSTLAGGEAQRIRLATQIGSGLVGVLYILDEPSIGLHQRDNIRLLDTLKRLRDLGNTVLVVEHDAETILSADHVIDMGPGAGENGGRVVFSGPTNEILRSSESLTGRYLAGMLTIPVPGRRRCPDGRFITIVGSRENNLQNITVAFPLGTLTCVSGVSGSGKSTLVIDTLFRALAQRLNRSKEPAGKFDAILGLEAVDKVIDIDQAPIGRTPRSNPATYTGLFTHVRELFAQVPESRMRGYKPGRYSFNVRGGRCEACRGDGIIKIEMHFLPDVYVMCEVCKGRRYNRETLEIRYKGLNIAEILDMTVDQALSFMENIPPVRDKLQTLVDVGLGYIRLGQSATTLSGGEAQRIKLARELSRRATGRTLYILDEPTTGLHFEDIRKLLDVLNRLVDAGNSVIIIEHNMDVIKSADYVIDLGPEGGELGGRVVATGTPEEIMACPESYTGRFLKRALG
ncbi:MAG: excinuclease ABC subunit UvrA [Deltaproteobacteria bacterium]|nr:excinuclease ABC subunit UvrA [Deltaproteobacteria bacterium]